MTTDLDTIKPVKFPKAWLTYKARIRRDLDRAYATEGGEEYFDADYVTRICAQAKQLEEWFTKLIALQIALTVFQVIGFISSDASLSLFGITLKQAAGVKEMLLAISTVVATATWLVLVSRDTVLAVIERLAELSTDNSALVSFEKLALPSASNMKVYVPRPHEDWIFPTASNKALFAAFAVAVILLAGSFFAFSLTINIVFFLDIYRQPTLGAWSYWVLGYAVVTFLFGLLWIARFYLPLPYRDKSALLELKALEGVNEDLLRRQREEIFGENSKYRKFKWTYRFRVALDRVFFSPIRAMVGLLQNAGNSLSLRFKRRKTRKRWESY
jgi:hypothetical protein